MGRVVTVMLGATARPPNGELGEVPGCRIPLPLGHGVAELPTELRQYIMGDGSDTVLVQGAETLPARTLATLTSSLEQLGAVTLVLVPDNDAERASALLAAGADDVVAPPHTVAHVLLRRSVARARRSAFRQSGGLYRIPCGPMVLDTGAREVDLADRSVGLSGREFDILFRLCAARGSVVRRDRLIREVWGTEEDRGNQVLDATIHRLRARLSEGGIDTEVVETVRGVGYRLAPSLLESMEPAAMASGPDLR